MCTSVRYLNNSGSRFVTLNKEGKNCKIHLETKSGRKVTRTVSYWSVFGDWALAHISYKGKRISVFSDSILED